MIDTLFGEKGNGTQVSVHPSLPEPVAERWQPLRSGLYNIYRYDWQEFWFDHGRLLLRGNNGTGKSRVLAMQLPFLLDGEILPNRVEPDGDFSKRIEWNLLMGRHDDRLGYTWIEFGRRDASGENHFFTLGIGMHAHKDKGPPDRWFFITSRRVGSELLLSSNQSSLLTRERLAEAIGGSGQVFKTAKEYRLAIDKALFQLGEPRYRALIELLIQLRKPQLTREWNDAALSDALSEALPPIEEQTVRDVAEAFKGLERDQGELEGFKTARDAVDKFLTDYEPYARMATRRRTLALTQRHSAYEGVMRKLRQAERERDNANAAVELLVGEIARLDRALHGADAKLQQLQDSPAMKDASALDRLREAAALALRDVNERAGETEEARERLKEAQGSQEGATRDYGARKSQTQKRAEEASRSAAPAGLAQPHEQHVVTALAESMSPEELGKHRRNACARADSRIETIKHLRVLHAAWITADKNRQSAEERVQQRQRDLEEALTASTAAHEAVEQELESVLDQHDAWRTSCRLLTPPTAESFELGFREWCAAGGHGECPLTGSVNAAYFLARQQISDKRAGQANELNRLRIDEQNLQADIERLHQRQHFPPPAPHIRNEEQRQSRPGAPLWRLVEFHDEFPESDRAPLEAALEASGILDAWVMPDGRALLAGEQDIFIDPLREELLESSVQLARVLKPSRTQSADECVVAVEGTLARIGFGRGTGKAWVDTSGAWANGTLFGAWNKPRSQHIGEAAREAERLRLLAERGAQLSALRQVIGTVESSIKALDRDAAGAEDEYRSAPAIGTLAQAIAKALAAAAALADAQSRLTEARDSAKRAAEEARTAREKLEADARDVAISELDDLEGLQDRVRQYRENLVELFSCWDHLLSAVRNLTEASGLVERTASDVARRLEFESSARLRLAEAEARRDTLEKMKGADIGAILQELAAARSERTQIDEELKGARGKQGDAREHHARFKQQVESESLILQERESERNDAADKLKRIAEAGFIKFVSTEDATSPDALSSVSALVALARVLENRLSDTPEDDKSWEDAHNNLHLQIQTLESALLPHDIRTEPTQADGLWRISAPFRGQNMDLSSLRVSLHDEIVHRRALLEEKERAVLENTLVGELATNLHKRLREGEEFVKKMNGEIEARPMSTGMSLKFRWDLKGDAPVGSAEARKRLLGVAGTWSIDDREALGRFLQAQINQSRQEDEAGSSQEILARALDYRRWHQFSIDRQQDGRWQRLTKRTHGTGSGGEKAVALTLPMFAAAAAHYGSAGTRSPRLIMLDEAFVGIDSDMRRKCMGLLAQFDLDFVMTSEREWGCYDTLPGVAIYQLSATAGIDAVYASRWVWNGREKTPFDQPPVFSLFDMKTKHDGSINNADENGHV